MQGLTRKQFLHGTLATALNSLPAAARTTRSRRRPNILLVIADEWRAQAFGHMGDANAQTPTFDRFARQSVSFRQAVAGVPICCPARASLITGQYPLTHGVYINDVPLKPRATTLGEALRNHGYKTGYIGKWHLYGSPGGQYERRLAFIPPEARMGFDYWKVCECTHDYNRSLYYAGDDPTPRYWPGYDAIAQTDDAIGFIANHADKPDPYALVLSWGPPHFPYAAPAAYTDRYKDRPIRLRPNVPPADRDRAIAELRGYYAAIAALDDCFERLLHAVEAHDPDNTIVLFIADHGEMAFSQGLENKLYPWEESIRIPFQLRYPARGLTHGTSDAPLNSPDIMPTLLGLAGLPVPPGIEGSDFSRGLADRRPAKDHPGSAFLSMVAPIIHARKYGFAPYRGVRTSRFTYVRSLDRPWLLYDNVADPFQQQNLIEDDRHVDLKRALEADLSRWLDRLEDRFEPAEAYLQRDALTHYGEVQWPVGYKQSSAGDWRSTMAPPAGQALSIDASLNDLLADPAARALIERTTPELVNVPEAVRGLSPRLLQRWVSPARIDLLDVRLRQLRAARQ